MSMNIAAKIASYPDGAQEMLIRLRGLIYEVAKTDGAGEISESLKWGELSYGAKKGSPIRMDWKAKKPNQVSVYFNCKTNLVETFREIYSDTFQFVGNREIVLALTEALPEPELKACFSMALRYQELKHLPLLGG
ncbi:protein of unknown function (DU1801) [Alteromonadaceae bacterium Bs31]|nr:protein of unknown function (DU1801) [Alteromonadaceae bacterium Bs31]